MKFLNCYLSLEKMTENEENRFVYLVFAMFLFIVIIAGLIEDYYHVYPKHYYSKKEVMRILKSYERWDLIKVLVHLRSEDEKNIKKYSLKRIHQELVKIGMETEEHKFVKLMGKYAGTSSVIQYGWVDPCGGF